MGRGGHTAARRAAGQAARAGGKSRRRKEEHPMKNQTFGVELETTGLPREQVARKLAAFFGTAARRVGGHYDKWHVPMPDGRHWLVESDGSVTDPSSEVVSPVCRWDDIPMVQEVARQLRAMGQKADSSCGIHVHVGLGEHTPQSLRRLVNIVNAKEDLLTLALGISDYRRGRWCRPVEPTFLREVNRVKPTTMDAFAELWYTFSDGSHRDWRDCADTHYDYSRYHLLNLHAAFSTERSAHTIEFRAFNGTLHAGKIKAYIQLCLAISQQALDCKAASPTRPDTDNPKYTFRCWLLRLGFIGDEFATAREHLIALLPGNAAWRQGTPS